MNHTSYLYGKLNDMKTRSIITPESAQFTPVEIDEIIDLDDDSTQPKRVPKVNVQQLLNDFESLVKEVTGDDIYDI